jgi:hypothetical protein
VIVRITPDPRSAMWRETALAVRNWFLMAFVIGLAKSSNGITASRTP